VTSLGTRGPSPRPPKLQPSAARPRSRGRKADSAAKAARPRAPTNPRTLRPDSRRAFPPLTPKAEEESCSRGREAQGSRPRSPETREEPEPVPRSGTSSSLQWYVSNSYLFIYLFIYFWIILMLGKITNFLVIRENNKKIKIKNKNE
jgi:hypothetical protein